MEAAEKLKAVKNAPSCPRDVVTDNTVAAESFVTAPQKVARTGDAEVGRRCLNINAPRGRDRRSRSWINFWLWIFNSDRPQFGFSSQQFGHGFKPKLVTFRPGEFALGVNRSSHSHSHNSSHNNNHCPSLQLKYLWNGLSMHFVQINLLVCRFSLVFIHDTARCSAWELYVRLLWGRVAGGTVRAYGANCQLTANRAEANNVTQTKSHNQPGREVNQKQNAGRKLAACLYPGVRGPAGPAVPVHIAHWFYLLIRTLCCFYLIFMPAAISISVIELSLSRQVLVVLLPGRRRERGKGLAGFGWLPSCALVGCLALGPSPRPPVRISKHVKNGFALDWRWPTPRGIQSDGRRRRRQCRTHPWKGLWLLLRWGEGS